MKAIGMDIGGTKIAAGVVDTRSGRVSARCRVPTIPRRGGQAVLQDVIEIVNDLRTRRAKPERLGIGLPELVSPDGRLMSDGSFGWEALRARDMLNKIMPTVFEADVRAAAKAEARFGAGVGLKTFVYVTIGTGISSCLVIDGQPFVGARGLTGTFASAATFVVSDAGVKTRGVPLEEFASGSGIARRHRLGDAKKIFIRAAAGHIDAAEIVTTAGYAIGAAIASLINVLDPERVVIGGGVGLSNDRSFERAMKHGVHSHVWSPIHREVPLVKAKLGPDAGIIGAALAAVS